MRMQYIVFECFILFLGFCSSRAPSSDGKSLWLVDKGLSNDKALPHLSKDLEIISLSDNKLTALPKEILELSNLKVLVLRQNGLTHIPKEILDMKKSLILLDLRKNPIVETANDAQQLGKRELKVAFGPKVLFDDDIIVDYAFEKILRKMAQKDPEAFAAQMSCMRLPMLALIDTGGKYDPDDSVIYPKDIDFNAIPTENNRVVSDKARDKLKEDMEKISNDIFLTLEGYLFLAKMKMGKGFGEHLKKWADRYRGPNKTDVANPDKNPEFESLISSIFPRLMIQLEERLMQSFEAFLEITPANKEYQCFKRYFKKLKELGNHGAIGIFDAFDITRFFKTKNRLYRYYFDEMNKFNNLANEYFGVHTGAGRKREKFLEQLALGKNLMRFVDNKRFLFRTIRKDSGLTPEYLFKYGCYPRLINVDPILPFVNLPGINDMISHSHNIETVGYTSGLISTTGSVYYSMDFSAGRNPKSTIPFYIYLLMPQRTCAVSSHIIRGIGKSGRGESNAEGAEEFVCTAVRPKEVIAARYVDDTGKIGEVIVNHKEIFQFMVAKARSEMKTDTEILKFLTLNHIDEFRAVEYREALGQMTKNDKIDRFQAAYPAEVFKSTAEYYGRNTEYIDSISDKIAGAHSKSWVRGGFFKKISEDMNSLRRKYRKKALIHSLLFLPSEGDHNRMVDSDSTMSEKEKEKIKHLGMRERAESLHQWMDVESDSTAAASGF